jgi:hypothetical protein
MAHGDTHIYTLQIGKSQQPEKHGALAITLCPLKVEVPVSSVSDYPPWLFVRR